MLRMKKLAICGALAGCSLILVPGISRAEVIPGVDEPFDPPNYYSPYSVSIPDSAPSVFTMRDLARQGGEVFDFFKHIRDQLKTVRTIYYSLVEMLKGNVADINAATWSMLPSSQRAMDQLKTLNSEGLLSSVGTQDKSAQIASLQADLATSTQARNLLEQYRNDTVNSFNTVAADQSRVQADIAAKLAQIDELNKKKNQASNTPYQVQNIASQIQVLESEVSELRVREARNQATLDALGGQIGSLESMRSEDDYVRGQIQSQIALLQEHYSGANSVEVGNVIFSDLKESMELKKTTSDNLIASGYESFVHVPQDEDEAFLLELSLKPIKDRNDWLAQAYSTIVALTAGVKEDQNKVMEALQYAMVMVAEADGEDQLKAAKAIVSSLRQQSDANLSVMEGLQVQMHDIDKMIEEDNEVRRRESNKMVSIVGDPYDEEYLSYMEQKTGFKRRKASMPDFVE